jgi:hypothetical protein
MDEVPHELLRDFTAWAERKGRVVDVMLLDELLSLRLAYDDLEPSYWPLDSVEHLLLERVPAKGSVDPIQPEVLTETLDAYFRFLRSTGRMSGFSADPRDLTKQVRRHVRSMQKLAADRTQWSPNKVLMDYGRSIGIDVDQAPDLETLHERMGEIQEAWNALPVEERRRLMPRPGDDPSSDADAGPGEETGAEVAMRELGVEDPSLALVMLFADRLPTGDLPPPGEAARQFRESSFVRQLVSLAEWVGEGRQVTTTGVLRPTIAHEVYDHLQLDEWKRAQLRREYPDERLPGVAAVGLDTWIDREARRPWRRAAECEPLHRLWLAALDVGLVTVSKSTARSTFERPVDDEGWLELGLRSNYSLMTGVLDRPYFAAVVLYASLSSFVDDHRLVGWDEVESFAKVWDHSPGELADLESFDWFRDFEAPRVRKGVGLVADSGILQELDDGVRLTAAGAAFLTAWLRSLQP